MSNDFEWVSGKRYCLGDIVFLRTWNKYYLCLVDHKANVFANDLFNLKANLYDSYYWREIEFLEFGLLKDQKFINYVLKSH